jgi:catechol 2,3-dioxygenase-like lactoylglutathione lyase family enzyme
VETVISNLLARFEGGRLSRRELVSAGAVIAAGGATAQAVALKSATINHTSVLVTDMARSIEFYNRVFGLSVLNEDKPNRISRLGIGRKVLVSLRVEPPAGTIDHFAIGVDGFNKDAVTRELQAMGLTPKENLEYGFYVDDPDGAHIQITGP